MNMALKKWQAALSARKAVKIIAGITNFNVETVLAVAKAAQVAGAQAVDVAADAGLIAAVKAQCPEIAIFASSIEPDALASAVAAGADMAELGNFDALYAEGIFISAEAVLELAQETIAKLNGQAPLCVTVPGHLTIESQMRLVAELEAMGVRLIQTEGAARLLNVEPATATLTAAQKEAITLHNTQMLAKATGLPVMTASGMTAENVDKAVLVGASAVGVGSYINQAQSAELMQERALALMAAMNAAVVLPVAAMVS